MVLDHHSYLFDAKSVLAVFRYIQVGNAVAVPVAIGLGYSFGLACQNLCGDEPLMTLPFKFPNCLARSSSQIEGGDSD